MRSPPSIHYVMPDAALRQGGGHTATPVPDIERVAPAGWATRHCTVEEFVRILHGASSPIIEISKDLIGAGVSLKALGAALERLRASSNAVISFAGTTDLVTCAGMDWERYRLYFAVQLAQARFLEASLFRFFVGDADASISHREVVRRVATFCEDALPIKACIEVHAGVECEPQVLKRLVSDTPVYFVVDVEQFRRTKWEPEDFLTIVPVERVAYVHERNLSPVWIEDSALVADESRWRALLPRTVRLWEPKTIDDPLRIEEILREYRTAH